MTDSFAERLARALDARDVKQVELAEKTGIRVIGSLAQFDPNFDPSPSSRLISNISIQ